MISNLVVLVAALLMATSTVTSEGSRTKRSDDGGPLEAVVTHLSQQVDTLTAQLTQQADTFNAQLAQQAVTFSAKLSQQNSTLSQMTTKLAALEAKTDSLDKVVAFYAWNSVNPLHVTPYGTLIFDHARTNQGNAYDTMTGVFTAPTSGMYYFQTVFLSYNSGGYARAGIFVDGHPIAEGISDRQGGQNDETTINAIIHVSAGQKVHVKNPDSLSYSYWGVLTHPHTTFSGFLINEG